MMHAYPADDPTFVVFYTGTTGPDDHTMLTVRATDEKAAREGFVMRTGITPDAVVPLVDVTHA